MLEFAVLCRFYFAYCEAAFDAHYIHDFQITWTKAEQHAHAESRADDSAAGLLSPSRSPPDPVTQVSSPGKQHVPASFAN